MNFSKEQVNQYRKDPQDKIINRWDHRRKLFLARHNSLLEILKDAWLLQFSSDPLNGKTPRYAYLFMSWKRESLLERL